jgi:hypothetical protein
MNRFIGHSQIVTTNNYNTLKITVTITHKIKSSESAASRCLVTNIIWIFNYWTAFWILLLMNLWLNLITNELLFITVTDPNRNHRLQDFHYCSSWMCCLGNHVSIPKQRFGFLSVCNFIFLSLETMIWYSVGFQDSVSPWHRVCTFVS